MKPDPKLQLVVRPVANFEAVNFGEERKSHSCDFSGVEIAVPASTKLSQYSSNQPLFNSPFRQSRNHHVSISDRFNFVHVEVSENLVKASIKIV
jgi:hypothetical protein